jgi:exonuclease III
MKKIKKKGGSTKLSHTTNREKLKSFIDRNNLTDVWRTLNPELERYTWREKTSNIQCRLHFFLISIGVLNVVNNERTDKTMAKRRTDKTMAKRRTDKAMAK